MTVKVYNTLLLNHTESEIEKIFRKKSRIRRYPAETITDTDYADDKALLAYTPTQAEFLQ